MTDAWEWNEGNVFVSEEPPKPDAEIIAFNPPSKSLTVSVGQTVVTTVTVKNNTSSAKQFWVGLSYIAKDATLVEWFDVFPVQTPLIQAGRTATVSLPFVIPESKRLRNGRYYAVARTWRTFNQERFKMEDGSDSTLWHLGQWDDDPEKGKETFSFTGNAVDTLDSFKQMSDFACSFIGLVDRLNNGVTSSEDIPTLQDLLNPSGIVSGRTGVAIKPLAYFGFTADTDVPVYGIGGVPLLPEAALGITAGMEMGLVIDLADAMNETQEGQDGWVTVWLDLSGRVGVYAEAGIEELPDDVKLAIALKMHTYPIHEEALSDYRLKLNLGLSAEVVAGSLTLGGSLVLPVAGISKETGLQGKGKFKFDWKSFKPEVGVRVCDTYRVDGLIGVEIRKNPFRDFVKSLDDRNDISDAAGFANAIGAYVLDMIKNPNQTIRLFNSFTYDDGDTWLPHGNTWLNLGTQSPDAPISLWDSRPFAHRYIVEVKQGESPKKVALYLDSMNAPSSGSARLLVTKDARQNDVSAPAGKLVTTSTSQFYEISDPGTYYVSVSAAAASGFANARLTLTESGAPPPPPELRVAPTRQEVEYGSGATTFTVSNIGGGDMVWTAEVVEGGAWAHFVSGSSGTNGGTIRIHFDENPEGGAERTATVRISAGSAGTRDVTVVQEAPHYLSVSPSSVSVPQGGGTATFNISANISWSITDDADWLTVTPTSGSGDKKVTVKATSANTGTGDRTATVTVTGGGVTQTVTVTQQPDPYLTVSSSSVSVPRGGGTATFLVSANVSWCATSGESWLTVSPASGSGNTTVKVTATANTGTSARSATVTVTATGSEITRTVTFTQPGDDEPRQITVAPVSARVDADIDIPILIDNADGVQGFAVTLNYPAELADYVSVSPGSLTAGWSIVPNGGTDGRVVISSAGATALSGSGSLCVVRLHTAASAGSGTISVNPVELNDGNIPSRGIPGVSFATTERFLWGDVNADAVVGTLDASGILKVVAGLPSVIVTRTPPDPLAGDVDGSGTIGTLDASYILKKVAGIIAPTGFPADTNHDSYGPETAPNAAPNNAAPSPAPLAVVPLGDVAARQLSVAPVSPPTDADVDIPIMIDDASDVEGFAVTLNYPAALADYVSVSPGSLTAGWSIVPNGNEDGKVVIAAAGATALSGSGSLCVVRLHTAATAGNGTMSLDPVELNDGNITAEGVTGIAWGDPSQPALSVTPASRSVSKDAGTTTFNVANVGSGTMAWTAEVACAWARITSGASGGNTGTITVEFDANPAGGAQRTATIRVTAFGATGSPMNMNVTVVQAANPGGSVLSVTPRYRYVPKDIGTATFNVANTGSGTMNWAAAVTSGGAWVRIISGASGVNAGTFTVGFDANPSDGRTATIRVTAFGATGSPVDVTVVQAGPPPLTITTSSRLPNGTVGSAYSVTLAASGGTTPYTWSRASGNLPVGLSLSSGGVISGKPTASGTSSFTVRVTDGSNLSSTKAFSLTINEPEKGVVFSENWESGQINTGKWKIWGDPAPTIVSGGNSIGNYALTSNGDSMYESGVTSLRSFEVKPGLTVSAKVFVQAPGTDVWSKRSWHGLALTSQPPAEWGNFCGTGEALIGRFINIRGNTPTDDGLSIVTPSGGNNYASAPYLDKWTTIAFTFNTDGSVTYRVDGQVLHTTSAGWINYGNVPAAYLVCGGRSEGSSVVNLHDDISVRLSSADRQNVALAVNGGIASAGSVGTYMSVSHPAANANDGDVETEWCNSWSMPDWLKVEFDQAYLIDRVGVVWGIGTHNQTFSISLSADGNNWTTVVTSRSSATDAGYNGSEYHGNTTVSRETFPITPMSARFVKIDVTASSAPQGHIFKAIVHELQAFQAANPGGGTEEGDNGGYLSDPADDTELATAGSYDGYFYTADVFGGGEASAVCGTLSLKVSDLTGKLTAKVTLQGGSVSFKGTSWTTEPDGARRAELTAPSGEKLVLFIRENRIWGTLTGGKAGTATLTLDGTRNRFAERGDAGAEAAVSLETLKGYYTVALPVAGDGAVSATDGVDAAPQGVGYLTIKIGNKGKVRIAGILADGTKVSRSSCLTLFDGGRAACVPLFAPLYSKKGWVGGLLWIDPETRVIETDRDLGWFIRWENPGSVGPDGFSLLLEACGGFYGTGASLAAAYLFGAEVDDTAYFAAGEAQEWAVWPEAAVAGTGNRLTITKGAKPKKFSEDGDIWYEYDEENPANATFSFASRTGIFKGKFKLYCDYENEAGKLIHKAVSVPYAGVLTPLRSEAFDDLPVGLGYCLIPDNGPAVRAFRLKRSRLVWLEESK